MVSLSAFVRGLLGRRFIRDVAVSYLFTAASLVANLLTGIIVARVLGADGRGEIAAILALTQVAGWVFAMGCNQAAAFHLARHPNEGGVLIGSWLMLLIPFAILGVVTTVAVLPVALSAQRDAIVVLGQVFATTIALALVFELLTGVMLGDHRFTLWNSMRLAYPAGVAVLYMLLWGFDALTVRNALIANAAMIAVVVVLAATWAVRRHGPLRMNGSLARSTLWYGLRVHGTTVAWTVNARLDLAIIPAFLGAASVGLYSVATNLAAIVGTLAASVVALVLPAAARRAERGAVMVVASMYAALAVGLLGALAIGALAEVTLRLLYGGEFVAAAGPLQVLLVGYVLQGPALVLSQGLSAANRPFTGTVPQAIGSVVTVVGLLLFLADGGIMAAAWVTTVAYAVALVAAIILYRRVAKLSWRALSPGQSLADLRSRSTGTLERP